MQQGDSVVTRLIRSMQKAMRRRKERSGGRRERRMRSSVERVREAQARRAFEEQDFRREQAKRIDIG
jgi:hypothetical protein